MTKSRIVILLLGLALAGCSDPTKGVVTGVVTINGNKPESGSIAFFPEDGKSPTAGGVIKDGAYEVTAPVGLSRVEIRVSKVTGKTKIYNTPDSPIQEIREEVLPKKYNEETELTYDVPAGKSQKDFELSVAEKGKR